MSDKDYNKGVMKGWEMCLNEMEKVCNEYLKQKREEHKQIQLPNTFDDDVCEICGRKQSAHQED